MDISNFELIFLYGLYVGFLWLTLSALSEKSSLTILHHSNTPTLLGEFLPAKPNSYAVAQRTKIFDDDVPNPGRLRSSSGLPSCQEERGGQFGKILNGSID
jgi:hypothetical protein